jgi:quercetin dioxygenase-like cupin family protein
LAYSTVTIDEIDPAGPGGAVRFVRRQLGALAFGINWFELPPESRGVEHDESDTGQEEVSVVIRGDGYWLVDGERVPASAGTFIRFDPESTRVAVAGADGMTFISVGAPPGAYEPRGPF